jgi:hypothetical protein
MNSASLCAHPAAGWSAITKTAVVDSPMSDRRSEKRWDVCLDAVWDGKSGNYVARVTDLSEGGCYVDSLGEAQIGEVLTFKLQLPDGEWLALTGEVAHQSPPLGFGLRFVTLSDEQREKLHSILDHVQPIS